MNCDPKNDNPPQKATGVNVETERPFSRQIDQLDENIEADQIAKLLPEVETHSGSLNLFSIEANVMNDHFQNINTEIPAKRRNEMFSILEKYKHIFINGILT